MTNKIDFSTLQILIVDDLPENIQLIANILSDINVAISFADNGEQAVQVAQTNQPDLILLDIQMPKMNGYQVCKKIQKIPQTKDIPIIFLSAKLPSDEISNVFETGAYDYISKPFNAKELLRKVVTLLELVTLRKQQNTIS